MTFRRGGSRVLTRPRRGTDWGIGPSISSAITISATGKVLWTTGTTPAQNLTVVRTRGLIHFSLITQSLAGGGFDGAVGLYLMTEDAFNVGVTAALDPLSDANSDMWLWHNYFSVKAVTPIEADGVNAFGVHQRIEIDSKAMRKDFDPERVMAGVISARETGTSTMDVWAETRQLFKSTI